MKNNQKQTKFVILVATFISIQLVMMLIPFLGFIPIFAINITTLHIPTILAGILLGVKGGAIVGLTFGIMSIINATFRPGLMSFLFSPFAPAPSGFSGNPLSLLVALLPRILLGVFAALIYKFIKNKQWKLPASTIAAVIATVLHTLMVISLIFIIFTGPYAIALELGSTQGVLFALGNLVVLNGIPEAILAGVLMTAFVAVLEPIVKKMVN
jgi:uncharacterized membrane protein